MNLPAEIDARFAQGELIAAIAQDHVTMEVLMLAWVNKQALELSLSTGKATYWSRSRNSLWVKGESSGHTQKLISVDMDCDGDAILYTVEQTGAACHTGDRTCFHTPLAMDN